MTPHLQLQAYLDRHFLALPDFVARTGLPEEQVMALIASGALPAPSYMVWPNGAFSSPIGGAHGPDPAGEKVDYFSPAAIWWARRAKLIDGSPDDIARRFRTEFISDFLRLLEAEELGALGYPQAYEGDRFDTEKAVAAGEAEWADWIDGGYGVCLRYWDARHAIVKTCQRGLIVSLTADGAAEALPPETLDRVLVAMQALEAVMLPFAPHQRPHGTPGLWIDRLLERFGFGGKSHPAIPSGRACA